MASAAVAKYDCSFPLKGVKTQWEDVTDNFQQ